MTQAMIKSCDEIIKHCDIDCNELTQQKIDHEFFDNYNNIRVVNSFLFNFSKLQDKIGAKLFRIILYEIKEIDDKNLPMMDTLHILEKLDILKDRKDWDRLREIRNALSHEYPIDIDERIENIQISLSGYEKLKTIYINLKNSYAKFKHNE